MPLREEIDITKLKYVLYARKSTKDKEHQIRSIKDQIKDCLEIAERYKLNVVKPYLKEEESAKNPDQRPVFDQMLKDIKEGKYNAILTWHPDRLARNMLEGGRIIDLIDKEILMDLKFHTHYFENNSSGKVLLGLAFVFAKNYTDELQERVTRGNIKNREDKKLWIPKHGYIVKNHSYQPNGKNFTIMKEAWQMRKLGQTIKEIAEWMDSEGYVKITKKKKRKVLMNHNILSKIFKDTFYYGEPEIAGDLVDLRTTPSFFPIVTKEEFILVQEVGYKKHHRKRSKNFEEFLPLRKMILCDECGVDCIVAASAGRNKRYLRYSCRTPDCPQRNVSTRSNIIFKYITNLMKGGINLTEKEHKIYYTGCQNIIEKKKKELQNKLKSITAKQSGKERERNNIAHQLLAHDKGSQVFIINNEQLKKIDIDIERYEEGKQGYKDKIAEMSQGKLSLKQFLNLYKNPSIKLEAAGGAGKDAICRLLFLNLTIRNHKVVSHALREPLKTFLELRDKDNLLLGGHGGKRLEPHYTLNSCFGGGI